jgi:Ca2+-transporting ATPase
MQATSLTYVTIMICQLLNILHLRSEHGIFTKYQLHNKHLFLAFAVSFFCIANIIYNPWIAPFFRAGSISGMDWLTAIVAGAIFVLFREMGHYGKRDHRDHIVKLHQETSIAKS